MTRSLSVCCISLFILIILVTIYSPGTNKQKCDLSADCQPGYYKDCTEPEEDREDCSKRTLMEDNYYTIITKLDNLTKEVDRLNQQLRAVKPTKNVAFKALLTTTISGGQKQVIVFDDVELNLGNAYNVLHGNFLAPLDGMYLFSIYACSHTAHTIVLDLMKNGMTVGRVLAGDEHYSNCNSNTFILQLAKADDIYVNQGTYGNLLFVNEKFGRPHFLGVLINAT